MIKRYFIVEGQTDEFILTHLLPKELLQDTRIIVAGGYSAALSGVQTLFTLTDAPIYFFFDTDTQSDDESKERKQFVESYLKPLFNNQFLVFPFKPSIEILFFYKKELLEKIVGQSISDELWYQGKYQPGKTLIDLLGCNKIHLNRIFRKKLTPDILQELRKTPLLQDIIKQLSAELTNESETAIAV